MIEFRDEILDGEPRYRVRGADGNLIHDEAIIEMGTHVAQEGTPLNKAFFENIQAYIKSTDRYTPTSLKITNEDSQYEKSFFPKTWEKVADGQYKNGNITISYSSEFCNGSPEDMFDGNLASGGVGNIANSTAYSHTIHMDYGEEIKITKMFVSLRTYIDTGTVKFQASKDNSSWIDIYSWGKVTEYTDYNIVPETPDWYRYYRFYVTGSYTSYVIREWQTITAMAHKTQMIEIPLLLDEYETNKMVNIIAPNGLDSTAQTIYANINNLGNKPIKGKMYPNTKYTLFYNGTEFDVTPIETETDIKNTHLEITDDGGTQTKNLQFRIGNGKLIALSLYGSTSYSIGITPSAFIILDTERNKFLFAIGNKRVIKYETTNSASGEVQSDVSTQPITMGETGTSRVDLANFWRDDSYGRVDEMAIYVSNISLSDGVLTIPISLYTNSRVQEQTASVSCFINVIN